MNNWLPERPDPGPRITQLLCFPHAGGGAAWYHRWERWLPASIQLLPVKLPGRESRFQEPAIDNLAEMTDRSSTAIVPPLREPFALFGHSMGALIAFELARRLRLQGLSPSILFVSSCPAPDRFSRHAALHQLPDQQMIAALARDYGQGSQTTPEELEMMRWLASTIRADLKMMETYRYEAAEPLTCPVVALSATEDTQVSRGEMAGWRHQTSGRFMLRTMPGHHFYLRDQEATVARLVASKIGAVV